MCTAITFENKDFYFGRTLDLEYNYEETVTVTPRNYPLNFLRVKNLPSHYAMIGVAYVQQGYPLYYEAVNEKGLGMAGLNFVGNAVFGQPVKGKDNVAPFEFIPWILGQCADLQQVRTLLKRLNLFSASFSKELPVASLHWMISSREGSLTVESVKEGLRIYDNPVGVLTNNPSFDFQMTNLVNYMDLTASAPSNRFCGSLKLEPYSRGMGAIGLPGDLSSTSRFVRAAFVKSNSKCGQTEDENVSQFFHILNSVFQPKGCVCLGNGKYNYTVYSCCCNTDKGIFYYTTYDNSQITGVDMHREDLDGSVPISYTMLQGQCVKMAN